MNELCAICLQLPKTTTTKTAVQFFPGTGGMPMGFGWWQDGVGFWRTVYIYMRSMLEAGPFLPFPTTAEGSLHPSGFAAKLLLVWNENCAAPGCNSSLQGAGDQEWIGGNVTYV